MNEKKFTQLLDVDIREHLEKDYKGLSYLSWATAYQIMMQQDPSASYTVLKAPDGMPYFTRGDVNMVFTEVTMFNETKQMWLPVMDNKHNSVAQPNSRQVSDAVMRCLVKNIAMFGLGLRVFRKEGMEEFDCDNAQLAVISGLMRDHNFTKEAVTRLTNQLFSKTNIRQLTRTQADELAEALRTIVARREQETSTPTVEGCSKPAPVKEAPVKEAPTKKEEPAKEEPAKEAPQAEPASIEVSVEQAEPTETVQTLTREQYVEIGDLSQKLGLQKAEVVALIKEVAPNATSFSSLTFEQANTLINLLRERTEQSA